MTPNQSGFFHVYAFPAPLVADVPRARTPGRMTSDKPPETLAARIIDASQTNSSKNPVNQPKVIDNVARQGEGGERRFVGARIESHLVGGKQALVPGVPLVTGRASPAAASTGTRRCGCSTVSPI